MLVEDYTDTDDYPTLEEYLDYLCADESIPEEIRLSVRDALLLTSELWIVETYLFCAGTPYARMANPDADYSILIPELTDGLSLQVPSLEEALRVCKSLGKKGVIHVYPNPMQRQ